MLLISKVGEGVLPAQFQENTYTFIDFQLMKCW